MAQVMLRTRIFLSGGNDMIRGVKIVSIPVRNQDVALKFYTEKVGFKVATDQPFGPGQRWIELLIPGADTALALFTPEGHENRIGGFQPRNFLVRRRLCDGKGSRIQRRGIDGGTEESRCGERWQNSRTPMAMNSYFRAGKPDTVL